MKRFYYLYDSILKRTIKKGVDAFTLRRHADKLNYEYGCVRYYVRNIDFK